MTGAPEGAVLDPVTGAFRWTPALNASGSYSVVFTASDGNKSSSETVTITVANANQAPQFVPMGLQLVRDRIADHFGIGEGSGQVVAHDGASTVARSPASSAEGRRAGRECVRQGRSRWSPEIQKKQ